MVAQRLPDTPFCNRAILEQDAERAFFDRTAGWTLPNTFFGDHVLVEKGVDTALFDELVSESRPRSAFFDELVSESRPRSAFLPRVVTAPSRRSHGKIGRFLWSHDDPEGRFPTLHSATRSSPRRERKAGGAPAEGASGAPSGQKPADPAVEP